jgi:hypothetical protein
MTGKWIWNGVNEWRIGTEFIQLDAYEDCEIHNQNECECTEVWLGDDKTGSFDTEGIFDTFAEAEKHAREFMRKNPNGWMPKDKQEPKEKVQFT